MAVELCGHLCPLYINEHANSGELAKKTIMTLEPKLLEHMVENSDGQKLNDDFLQEEATVRHSVPYWPEDTALPSFLESPQISLVAPA